MRLRLGLALLTLAAAPVGTPAHAATTVDWPAFANIIVTSSEQPDFQPPRWRVESAVNVQGDLSMTPDLDCSTEFAPRQFFAVTCRAQVEPPPIHVPATGEVVNRAWQCWNAAVRADIDGPIAGEAVTGSIVCGEPQGVAATCTATANTGGPPIWQGSCVAVTNANRLPIRCMVDLTRVWLDHWQVTCYSTDP